MDIVIILIIFGLFALCSYPAIFPIRKFTFVAILLWVASIVAYIGVS